MEIRKYLLMGSLIAIISSFAAWAGSNRVFNRYDKRQPDYSSFGRPAGLFSSVHGNKYKSSDDNKTRVECVFVRLYPFYELDYIDNDKNLPLDARANLIRTATPFGISFLKRETDYDTHKPTFNKADVALAREEAKYRKFFETPAQ